MHANENRERNARAISTAGEAGATVNFEPAVLTIARHRSTEAMRTLFLSSLLALLATAVLAVADARACDCECDEDSDCHGLELCNLATNECQRPTDECACDADCDDGLFCNGTERCDLFAGCVAGEEIDCSEGDSECSCGVCDEEIQG